MLFTLQILFWFPIIFVFLFFLLHYVVKGSKAVSVVVLGDIGRSPRMQYHAASLSKEGYNVDIVGYPGSALHKNIQDAENIEVYYLREPPKCLRVLPKLVVYVLKVIWQSASLGVTLLLLPKSKYIFVQNPPSIPTIAVSWVVCLLRFSQLVIDWHNYGYTILGLSLGRKHLLVKFSTWYERVFGKCAVSNLCVTNAMKEDLQNKWGIKAVTFYDRPPEHFQQTPLDQKHDLFVRLGKEYSEFQAESPERSVFTVRDETGYTVEQDTRPALLISSTSWTEDEDFGLLLKALEIYEEAVLKQPSSLPNVLCVITGKGPQKDFYQKMISDISLSHVKFCLPWLTPEDYPKLLGSADVGVCLHKSSSGLDLPMKVVDMFGCGLPVCAVHFDCLSELVKHNENGLVFHDSEELAQQLQELLTDFPSKNQKLGKMRDAIKKFQETRWHQQWRKLVLPIFQEKEKDV